MDKTIIVVDGKVTLKLGKMTFAPTGSYQIIVSAGDSFESGLDGSWWNYTQDIFWSAYGQQEYAAAVAEYETTDDDGTG